MRVGTIAASAATLLLFLVSITAEGQQKKQKVPELLQPQRANIWRIQGKITELTKTSMTITRANKKTMTVKYDKVEQGVFLDSIKTTPAALKKGLDALVVFDYDTKKADQICLYVDEDPPNLKEGPLGR